MLGESHRRAFIAALGGALAWPLGAGAEDRAMPTIGFLGSTSAEPSLVDEFRRGLSELGYVEGRNVVIEYRWAERRYDRLPELAADLIKHNVTVLFAGGPPAAIAAKKATNTIPIVFTSGDPVLDDLSGSLSRPDANLTGLQLLASELGPKRVDLAQKLIHHLASLAVTTNPNFLPSRIEVTDLKAAASKLGINLVILEVPNDNGFDAAFVTAAREGADVVIVAADIYSSGQTRLLVDLAAKHKLPTIYGLREFAEAGGLISYGNSVHEAYRQMGVYVGRILNGAKPADLPVVQLTNLKLVINLKTANSLGLTIPPILLAMADEVIE
jgi:putative ABC transport system substrate-binding protein